MSVYEQASENRHLVVVGNRSGADWSGVVVLGNMNLGAQTYLGHPEACTTQQNALGLPLFATGIDPIPDRGFRMFILDDDPIAFPLTDCP